MRRVMLASLVCLCASACPYTDRAVEAVPILAAGPLPTGTLLAGGKDAHRTRRISSWMPLSTDGRHSTAA
jgi:hypothetical protein